MKLRQLKNKRYVIDVQTASGVRSIPTGCTDKAEAEKVITLANVESVEALAKAGTLSRELMQRLVPNGAVTVMDAFIEWSLWFETVSKSNRTPIQYKRWIEGWAKNGAWWTKIPSDVTTKDLSDWVNASDGTTKAVTMKSRLSAMRSFFGFCLGAGYVTVNPCVNVRVKQKELTHIQMEATRRYPFTDDEVDRIIDYVTLNMIALRGDGEVWRPWRKIARLRFWYCAVLLARHAGFRIGDVCRLERHCLTTEPGRVVVWTEKRQKRVSPLINEGTKRAIDFLPEAGEDGFYFGQQRDIHDRSPSNLSMDFDRMLTKLGIIGKSFHCLRHTKATEMIASGNSLEDTAALLGHSSTKTTAGYVH